MSTWTDSTHCVDGSLRQGPRPGGTPLAPIPINQDWDQGDCVVGSLRQGGRNTVGDALRRGLGAGRSLDLHWPINVRLQTNNTTVTLGEVVRPGILAATAIAAAQAPGATTALIYKGRPCYKMSAPTGRQVVVVGPYVSPHHNTPGAEFRGDFTNFMTRALLAFEPSGSGSLGLELFNPSSGSAEFSVFLPGGVAGFSLRPDTNGDVQFRVRAADGGGYTYSETLDYNLDPTEWNFYEMFVLGATDDEAALFIARLNGDEVMRLEFDALLPAMPLTMGIGTRAGGTVYLPPMGALLAAAPTYEALL